MEAIIYDLAQSYKKELPPDAYQIWQPRKLLLALLEIDPYCDLDSTIAVGLEDTPGVASSNMQIIGTSKKISLKTIKDYYDAFGSYLHTPTMSQLSNDNSHDIEKLRTKCEIVYVRIDNVLQSNIYNSTMGNFTSISCMDCGSPVNKRVTHLEEGQCIDAKCLQCGFPYKILAKEGGRLLWSEDLVKIKCVYDNCNEITYVRQDKVKKGAVYRCLHCGRRIGFALGVVKLDDDTACKEHGT